MTDRHFFCPVRSRETERASTARDGTVPRLDLDTLDSLIARRFPRVVEACARYEYDHIRAIWLHVDGCVPAIIAEYRHVMERE